MRPNPIKARNVSLAELFAPEKGDSQTRRAALTRARNALTYALTGNKSEKSAQNVLVGNLSEYRLEIGTMNIYSLAKKANVRERKILHNFGPSSLIILQERLARHRVRMQLYRVRRNWKGGEVLSERRVQRLSEPP